MPIIRIEMFEGRDSRQKKQLVKDITDAFILTCGGKKESVHIIIVECSPNDWAVAGEIVSDARHK